MTRTLRLLVAACLAAGAAIGRSPAAPAKVALTSVEGSREADRFTFQVDLPTVETSGSLEDAEIRVPGLDTRELRAGFPDLPEKTILVAIPPDVTPVLEVRVKGERAMPGILPRGALTRTVDRVLDGAGAFDRGGSPLALLPDGVAGEAAFREERLKDAKVYAGEDVVPHEVAWLGKIGVLRNQRYVEVHVAPVRYDPGLPGLRVNDGLELTVRFDGDAHARSNPRPEPVFEGVYRNAFLNYGQGSTFRLNDVASSAAHAAPPAIQGGKELSVLSAPLYRLRIRANGVVRLDYATISGTPFASVPLSTWKLTSRGAEVALQVQDDGDDILEPGEWVQFYGQALDDEPKTVVNTDLPGPDDLYEMRDFSDENIYFLTGESGTRARIPVLSSTPTKTRIPPTDFTTVAHAEVDDTFKPLDGNDPWFWMPFLCYGCGGTSVTSRTDSIALPGLASGTQAIHAIVRLRGSSEDSAVFPDHRTRVTLMNGSSQVLTTNDDNGTFDGRVMYHHDFNWTYPGSGFQATDPMIVKTETLSSGALNQVVADWIELYYQRTFAAAGDTLRFDWPNADAEFIVSGLASAAPAVYEITDHVGSTGIVSAVRLTDYSVSGAGPYAIRFRVDQTGSLPAQTPRHFVVTGDGAVAVPAPADFTPDTVSDLRNTSNQADLIVISNPLVLDTSPGSPLNQFIALRASQGIVTKVALIEDIQDEFNDGLAGPVAIKKFLSWVLSKNAGEGWADPKPAYVLILGDGSYDYKGGTASGNYVPTQILIKNDRSVAYYASDNVMADVVGGDQLADLVIGRLSARSVAESNLMLQKILDYQQNPPTGNWRHNTLFISDRGKDCDPNETADFEQVNDDSEAFMSRPPYTDRKLKYGTDYCPVQSCPCYPAGANLMRAAIKSAVNGTDGFSDGAAIVQYVGHGNYEWWSDDAFLDDFNPPRDTSSLVNGGRLPWLMVHTCLTGGFHQTSDVSMGEDWLKRSGGGAVAVFAPSGLDYPYIAFEVVDAVWNDLFGPPKRRDVATPILDALVRLCSQGAIDTCQHYTYLGDPSMSLVLPSVNAPGVPVAVPGSLRVDLSWAPSLTPGTTYKVFRGTVLSPNPNYTMIASGLSGTTYADLDPTLQNEITYYYYVLAVDASGYESAWSNFNSDCQVNGPDCVKATPTNPLPPAIPAGVAVTDTERGGSLRVTWTANTEHDLKGYTVWFGTSSGSYTGHADAGKTTSLGLTGLTNGQRYYVAVTSTNLSLHTSAFSTEVSGVPTSVQGIKPPSFIQTLHIERSGLNAVLTWGAITTDVYGKPDTIAFYEVFRGTTPDFLPALGNRIGTPATPTYTDVGAIAGPSYYYVVRAVDTSGNQGGLGFDLPNGIGTLQVSRAGGLVTLSWPAVTTTFAGGGPTRIDHYNVYVSGTPFSRAQIRDGVVLVSTTATGTSIQLSPPAAKQFYSVLAVDVKGNLSPF